jgi:tetratricopeptide (TPR) repeat protein
MGRIAPSRAGRIEELEAAGAEGAAGAPVELTPEQFVGLKKSLGALPRNLKIAVQDIIAAGKGSAGQLAALVSLLVQGASAEDIAALAGRIAGKRIRIPAGYEKKTGAAFEAERRTFGYAFRENIFPVLRLFVLSSLAVGLVSFLGYRFVYRPLYAYANYSRGYEHISAERYSLANERFSRAVGVWPRRGWFYRYADAFAGKRQFALAGEKYEQLLLRYPGDRRGILDYARMESRSLSNYEKADKLLQQLLDKNLYDYDALLATGDNNLEWAERDPLRFEEARRSYAALITTYGQRDALLFRMLRYFIRTKKIDEVERLRVYYAERPGVRVDPDAFAELGGYLTDVNRLDYVPDVLFRAMRVRADLPEIHYALARYYKILKDTTEERKALEKGVLPLLRDTDTLTKRRMTIEIDTHTRLGELHYRQEAFIDAGRELTTAVQLVERYQKMGLIRAGRIFGQPYVDLGDLQYYIEGDLGAAFANYQKAAANEYADPLLDYKLGYIRYAGGDYEASLGSFLEAEEALVAKAAPAADGSSPGSPRPPANLLFSIGNAFYQRADYFAAQGYYLRLLDTLTTRKAAIGILQPDQQPEHRALLDALVKVDNNLGVVMVRLAERTGDRRKKSQALVSLASASETADALSRVPETLVRSEAKNLPFLNMRGVLYPVSGFELQIYRMIPKDFETLFF